MTFPARNTLNLAICICCISLFQTQVGSCQESELQAGEYDDFFSSDEVVDLTLITDLPDLLADVGEDPSYHDGVLIYHEPDGHEVKISVRARARGNFRKNPANCKFPPIKIQFAKEDTPGTLFSGYSDLKIVSHCQSAFPEFEQYVLQEYLIYKLYNIFTDLSFRVRLVRIRYLNLNRKQLTDSIYHYAFFIENPESMAARNGGSILELENVPQDRLARDQYALVDLFNYMIINTDYSIPIIHNIELVSMDYFEPPIPVPFDFDWSGLINIPYNYNYNHGTGYPERVYKGPCRKRRTMNRVIEKMKENRAGALQLYISFPYLDPDVKTRILNDLNNFFIIIENRKLIREEFMKKCKE